MDRLETYPDAAQVARAAADVIEAQVRAKPGAVILVATGNTPMLTYEELARRRLDFSHVCAAQLDEYVGVDARDPRSLYGWMERAFVAPLGVTKVLKFQPCAADLDAECRRYSAALAGLGGIDLAVLGLGPNGHIGFNEPPSDADAPTRRVTLSDASIASNAAYWQGREVPRQALTVGMREILGARACLLLVTGAHKRAILTRALTGDVTPEVPASLLTRAELTVIADKTACP